MGQSHTHTRSYANAHTHTHSTRTRTRARTRAHPRTRDWHLSCTSCANKSDAKPFTVAVATEVVMGAAFAAA